MFVKYLSLCVTEAFLFYKQISISLAWITAEACFINQSFCFSDGRSAGIPLVCFLVLLPLNIPWSQISVTWLGVVHFLACLSPQLGSVLYHLFMNHEGGEPVYHTLLKLDVCGICMINTLGEASCFESSCSWKLSCNCWSVCCVGGISFSLSIVNDLP